MKILIIGDASSIFNYEFIKNVALKNHYKITFIDLGKPDCRYNEFYRDNDIILYRAFGDKKRKLSKLLAALQIPCKIKREYDAILVMGMWFVSVIGTYLLRKYASKIIISYWGSDVFEAPVTNHLAKVIISKSHFIAINSLKMKPLIVGMFGESVSKKIRLVGFGSDTYNIISETCKNITKEDAKIYFNIDTDKTVISIGYSGTPEHKHIEIIKTVNKLSSEMQDKIILIFQVTYGLTDKYLAEIKRELLLSKCEYKIFTSYLSYEELALMRLASDIFIHAQATDARSASVREYLLTDCTAVFNGNWINYPELEESGIRYMLFSDFDELRELLISAMQCLDRYVFKNSDKLRQFADWEMFSVRWTELFATSYEPVKGLDNKRLK